jgi:hypothetical protein
MLSTAFWTPVALQPAAAENFHAGEDVVDAVADFVVRGIVFLPGRPLGTGRVRSGAG